MLIVKIMAVLEQKLLRRMPGFVELTLIVLCTIALENSLLKLPLYIIAFQLLFPVSTFWFDVVHAGAHVLLRSRSHFLRKLGSFHIFHHRYFDQILRHQEAFHDKNLIYHLLPEFLMNCAT